MVKDYIGKFDAQEATSINVDTKTTHNWAVAPDCGWASSSEVRATRYGKVRKGRAFWRAPFVLLTITSGSSRRNHRDPSVGRHVERVRWAGPLGRGPAEPPVGIVVVNDEGNAGSRAGVAREPGGIESQHQRPARGVARRRRLPASAGVLGPQPPVGIVERGLPSPPRPRYTTLLSRTRRNSKRKSSCAGAAARSPATSRQTLIASAHDSLRSGTLAATNTVSAARSRQTDARPWRVGIVTWGGPQAMVSSRASAAGGTVTSWICTTSSRGAAGVAWSASKPISRTAVR